jgi:hypothetical protein
MATTAIVPSVTRSLRRNFDSLLRFCCLISREDGFKRYNTRCFFLRDEGPDGDDGELEGGCSGDAGRLEFTGRLGATGDTLVSLKDVRAGMGTYHQNPQLQRKAQMPVCPQRQDCVASEGARAAYSPHWKTQRSDR